MKFNWIDPEFPVFTKKVRPKKVRRELTDILLQIYCRKNIDGTKHLALPGNYLYERIGRRLEDNDLPIISSFLIQNRDVVSVELSYNGFSRNDLRPFMNSLIDNDSLLRYLSLMNCGLGIDELEILSETIGKTKIEILRINDNSFGCDAPKFIENLLTSSAYLSLLDIGNIAADWGLLSTLVGALVYPNINIQVLDISRIVPNSSVSLEHTEYLAELIEIVISRCHTLKEIHARHNSLDGHDVDRISKAIVDAKNLVYLDLAANRIGDRGAEYIAESLLKRPALVGLNLSSNNIGEIGGRALGHAVPHSVLRMLDVSRNRMRLGGLRILLHCLKKPHWMRILGVWGNHFDNTAAKVVYRMQLSGVLQEDCIDVRAVYEDGLYRVAEKTNPSHMLRHRYYMVRVPPVSPMDPYVELERKLKIDFTHVARLPRPEPPKRPSREGSVSEEFLDVISSYSISPSRISPCICRSTLDSPLEI